MSYKLGGRHLCGRCGANTSSKTLAMSTREKSTIVFLCPLCMDKARELWMRFLKQGDK